MNDLSVHLMDLAKEAVASDDDARALAVESVGRLGGDELRELAVREVVGWIEHLRRSEALVAERAASSRHEQRETQVAQRREKVAEAKDKRDASYEAWLADPSMLDNGRSRSNSDTPTVWLNASGRTAFIKWLGDRYPEWYEDGCVLADRAELAGKYASNSDATLFKADFYASGPMAWYAQERARYTTELVNKVSEQVRLDTTEKLLTTVFALGDGARVTWGKATVEEHEQRIALLSRNATGVIETAARHRTAIAMIRAAGARCLSDLATTDSNALDMERAA